MNSSGVLPLESVLLRDVHMALHSSKNFVSEFLPDLLLIVLIFLATIIVAWFVVFVCGALGRGCRLPEHLVRLIQYFLWFLFFFMAVAAAFGIVGVDFAQLFIGFGLLSIAFSAGASTTIANAFAGIMLQTTNLFMDHRTVKLLDRNLEGELISMNLLHAEMLVEGAPDENIRRTVLIPNTLLTDTPVEVVWHSERKKHKSRDLHTDAPQFIAYPERSSRFSESKVGVPFTEFHMKDGKLSF